MSARTTKQRKAARRRARVQAALRRFPGSKLVHVGGNLGLWWSSPPPDSTLYCEVVK